jgi:hypothetical protein
MSVLIIPVRGTDAAPIPVNPARDFLDYVGAFSGVIGALLAAVAILYAARQSAQAKRDLARERRLQFELELLAKVRRQMSTTKFQHLSGYVGALVRQAEDEIDIPVLRAIVGTKAGPLGRQRRDEIRLDAKSRSTDVQSEWLKTAAAEIDAAIDRRLESEEPGCRTTRRCTYRRTITSRSD